jgi:acetolactate synthase I/II/III large subunit
MTKVYEAVARAISDEMRGPVFGLLGDGNLELMVEFAERFGRPLVHARHEQNAVAMADGYARFSNHPGLCSVTQGPGLTNTATSLTVARHHHSPVLLLAGQSALGDVHNAQRLDQIGFSALTAGAGAVVEDARALAPVLESAFRHLHADRGPFVINLPHNVQEVELGEDWSWHSGAASTASEPDPEEVDRAADWLASAKQPANIAGQGAVRADADLAISNLSTYLGAPIASSLPAKGFCSSHPLAVGVSGGLGEGIADQALKNCDVLVAIGTSLNQWTTRFGEIGQHAKIVQIDHDASAFGTYLPPDLSLLGDARLTTEKLYAAVQQRTAARSRDRWPKLPSRARISEYVDAKDGSVDPRRALAALDQALSVDRIVVADGGHCVQATCQYLSVHDPRNWAYSFDFGCIGQGLGLALGACFARPGRRVTLITGDGAFMMGLADLDTAVRYQLPLTVIVLNDNGLGQERHSLEHKGLPGKHAQQSAPDFAQLASSLGGHGVRIHGARALEQLRGHLETAEASGGLWMFDIPINGGVTLPVSTEITQHMH